MRTNHILLLAALCIYFVIGPVVAESCGAHRGTVAPQQGRGGEETVKQRAQRIKQLKKAVAVFDAESSKRWEEFQEDVHNEYDRSFQGTMDRLRRKTPQHFIRLGSSSWRNVIQKLPKVAAHVHKEVAPRVHEEVKTRFERFVETELRLVGEFQQQLEAQFPELMPNIAKMVRRQGREEAAQAEQAAFQAWVAFCRAAMAQSLPQPGESYAAYFSRMNARYWAIMRTCTEQYLARMHTSNEVYRTRLVAFNQAYWASIQASTSRYTAYLYLHTQMYFAQMTASTQLYASYIRNSTQSYVQYVQRSHQNYLGYIQRSNQMYWDYCRFWTVVYYKRLGVL